MLRVDNVPWYLKPFFLLYGYIIGYLFYLNSLLIHVTCKIKFTRPLPVGSPVVYCIWHQDLLPYFGVFCNVEKQVWMNHPAWYMKPVHVLLELTGIEHICLGSSGNSGKAALANVIDYLKQGYSTTVACDGPAGPPLELKPGVLLMSRDAKIPVVPLRFSCRKAWRLGRWDRKFVPAFFTEIIVHVGEPVRVTEANLEESSIAVTKHLNGEY